MPDITFNCPHCQISIEAPEEMAGETAQCPGCQQDVLVPKLKFRLKKASAPLAEAVPNSSGSVGNFVSVKCPGCGGEFMAPERQSSLLCMYCGKSLAFQADKPASSPLQTEPPQQGTAFISLCCSSCGGQVDYRDGSDIATCTFCGSKTLIRTPAEQLERLRDFDNGSLPVMHCPAKLSAGDVREIIVKQMEADSAGYRGSRQLNIKVDQLYFPAWRVDVEVHCTWNGKYSEVRTVTKWRTVKKPTGRRIPAYPGSSTYVDEIADVQEPYTAQETVWHPTSGTHDFSDVIFLGAAKGISAPQFTVAVQNIPDTQFLSGAP